MNEKRVKVGIENIQQKMRKITTSSNFQFYTSMENLRVIRVKVVAPEKPLDVNTIPINNPDVDFTTYIVSKYLCGYGQLRYPKILYVDLGLLVKTKITVLDIKPMPYSLACSVLSLSPQSAISHSLFLYSLANSPSMFYPY
jgi:hypothetical protein